MGLFSWLFPSPADRLAKAQTLLDKGRHADARAEAMDLDLPGASEIVAAAEAALCQANLDAAVSWASAGDPERIEAHLETAMTFGGHASAPAVQAAREQIQQILQDAQAAVEAAAEADAQKLFEVDDRFLASQNGSAPPLPPGVTPQEAEALQVRLELWMDAYPEHLRPQMIELGPDFAGALVDLDEGRFEPALQALVALPDDQPLVQHERARAALALGDPAAAARAWRTFATLAGGHQPMGPGHTAIHLADAMARSGDPSGALQVLTEARAAATGKDKGLGGMLYALLLEAQGELAAAEAELRRLLKQHPKAQDLYVVLARVRAAGGHRVQAMQALETSLGQTICVPGRCGYQPPHLATNRLLATLYLEDGVEHERALELADTAAGLIKQPTWDDLYLHALASRARGADEAAAVTARLVELTPEGDPRHERIREHLAA